MSSPGVPTIARASGGSGDGRGSGAVVAGAVVAACVVVTCVVVVPAVVVVEAVGVADGATTCQDQASDPTSAPEPL